MPALRLLRRRWGIAGDDVILAIPTLLFHLAWVITLPAGYFWRIHRPNYCQHTPYRAGFFTLYALTAVTFIIEAAIFGVGLRGSIFETHRRRAIPPLLYSRFTVLVCEIGILIYASVLITHPHNCTLADGDAYHTPAVLHAWVWSTWAIIAITVLIMLLSLKFWPDYSQESSWEKRIKLFSYLCCCAGRMRKVSEDGESTPITRLAYTFTTAFGYVDLTVTDFVTALLLAAQLQQCRRRRTIEALLRAEDEDIMEKSAYGPLPDMEAATRGHVVSAALSHPSPGSDAGSGRRTSSAGGSQRRLTVDGVTVDHEESDLQLDTMAAQHRPRRRSNLSAKAVHGDGAANGHDHRDASLANTHARGTHSGAERPRSLSQIFGSLLQSLADKEDRAQDNEPLLTPSAMAVDMRQQLSVQQALDVTTAQRERVSDEDVAEATYYCKYSYAAYGYLLYVFSKPLYTAWCQLCCGRGLESIRTLFFSRHFLSKALPTMNDPLPTGAVSQSMNREAIQQITGLDDKDIVFVRFEGEGGPHCLPYFIGLDHEKESVVVSIRGTLSVEDTMTDLLCESAKLDDWMKEVESAGTPETFQDDSPANEEAGAEAKYAAHAGILDSARAIVNDLRKTGVLRKLFQFDPGANGGPQPPPIFPSSRANGTDASDASMPATGDAKGRSGHHPAGPLNRFRKGSAELMADVIKAPAAAAGAALRRLGVKPHDQVMSRHRELVDCRDWRLVITGHSLGAGAAALVALYVHNFFPKVRCWAFEPPGGLMTRAVSRALQPICTTTALAKDIVPRLGVATFEHLREDMIMAAVRCKRSKWWFLVRTFFGKDWQEQELFYPPTDVTEEALDVLLEYQQQMERVRSDRKHKFALARTFVLPGRIMYLRKVREGKGAKKSNMEPVWITCDDLNAEGILVSTRMFSQHMPAHLLLTMQRLAKDRTGNTQARPPVPASLGVAL